MGGTHVRGYDSVVITQLRTSAEGPGAAGVRSHVDPGQRLEALVRLGCLTTQPVAVIMAASRTPTESWMDAVGQRVRVGREFGVR